MPFVKGFAEENEQFNKHIKDGFDKEYIMKEYDERHWKAEDKFYDKGVDRIIDEYAPLKNAKVKVDDKEVSVHDYLKSNSEVVHNISEEVEDRFDGNLPSHER